MIDLLLEICMTVVLLSTDDIGPVFKTSMTLEKYTYTPGVLKSWSG